MKTRAVRPITTARSTWSLTMAGNSAPLRTILFLPHRLASHTCDPDGILPEDGVLEVNTNDCGYAFLGQPILADVQPGDWVELLMYHSALASVEDPAEGHFSLWLGETRMGEDRRHPRRSRDLSGTHPG